MKINELSSNFPLWRTKRIELKCSIIIAVQIAASGFIPLMAQKLRYNWKQQSTNLLPVNNARLRGASGSRKLGKTKRVGAGEPYSLCKPPEKRDREEGVPFLLSLIPLSPPPHFPFPFDSCHADRKSPNCPKKWQNKTAIISYFFLY